MYDYAPRSSTELALVASQTYVLAEDDTGSRRLAGNGWTSIRSKETGATGLVPTSYISEVPQPPLPSSLVDRRRPLKMVSQC